MMRRAARVDRNHGAVAKVFSAHGMSVISLAAHGSGCPDLLVGAAGETYLVEVKDGRQPPSRRTLTPDQVAWHASWLGRPVDIITGTAHATAWCRLRLTGADE
jgi:Holliday junction resolvase